MTEKKEGIVVVKGTKWRKKISKSGDSFCLIIPPYALAYLGVDVEAARKGHAPFVICKADYSEKHGAFIGFGLDEEHDKAQFAKAVAESRAQLGKENQKPAKQGAAVSFNNPNWRDVEKSKK